MKYILDDTLFSEYLPPRKPATHMQFIRFSVMCTTDRYLLFCSWCWAQKAAQKRIKAYPILIARFCIALSPKKCVDDRGRVPGPQNLTKTTPFHACFLYSAAQSTLGELCRANKDFGTELHPSFLYFISVRLLFQTDSSRTVPIVSQQRADVRL